MAKLWHTGLTTRNTGVATKKEKKPVIMLSYSCSAAMSTVTTHNQRPVAKPVVVDSYKQSMNSVNIAEQYAVYYSFIRKNCEMVEEIVFCLIKTVNIFISTLACPKSQLFFVSQ